MLIIIYFTVACGELQEEEEQISTNLKIKS
jgi:hypothetical protein